MDMEIISTASTKQANIKSANDNTSANYDKMYENICAGAYMKSICDNLKL